jgi:hypothetical protein
MKTRLPPGALMRGGWLLLALVISVMPHSARAFDYLGSTWPSGNIPMTLQLDVSASPTTFPLTDGSASWNSVAQSVIADWNARMSRTKLTATISSAAINNTATRRVDHVNRVFFATDYYGSAFDFRTLAVTLVDNGDQTIRSVEADLVVNNSRPWNSYRGAVRNNPVDLRRVLLHEFGHVIGLTHPDEAGQSVSAIMNSTISDVEVLQGDDIAGAAYLYNTPIRRPTITTQPTNQGAAIGGSAKFTLSVDGQDPPTPDDFHSYHWYFKATGATDYEPLFTLIKPGTLNFGVVQADDAGSYYFVCITPDDTVQSNTVALTATAVTPPPATQLANLSTRGIGGNSVRAMTVGFVITGARSKTVLLRAAGPSLANFGVNSILADPQLVLKNSSGATVATSSAIWDQSPNAADIRTASARTGAFALNNGSRDGVVLVSLPPGNYTATAASPAGATGTVLIELYDADEVRDTSSRIINLSTRGYVTVGGDTLIAGFVVQGPGPRTYLIRVAGDTLQDFGITGTLDDPYLKLFTGSTLIREKDDWDSPATSQSALRSAFTQVGAFPFNKDERQEPAMLVTLLPGSYTAQVSGLTNNGRSNPAGYAQVEIYEMP